ncbi:hypothetical protein K1719_001890 [Acacia pycnantha]|nr:hypothetical protein K1719_001890 [Acacia pycnantha]
MASSKSGEVPKGYLTVYVGEEMKIFVILISYLNRPLFQELLSQAEEEKSMNMIIQLWELSPFLAEKTSSSMLQLLAIGAS